jgi:hypothetical protein
MSPTSYHCSTPHPMFAFLKSLWLPLKAVQIYGFYLPQAKNFCTTSSAVQDEPLKISEDIFAGLKS